MPKTILNEENLREYLTTETLRLNLENHYWIKNNMIDKIGKMSPNIQVLNLRRMKFINNPAFAQVFKYMRKLEKVDLSDCAGLLTSACNLLIDNNRSLSHIQLSGCNGGVDNEVLSNIAKHLTQSLNFLDISYCKEVTDEGLAHFNELTYPMDSLMINGCSGISGAGLKQLLHSFKDTLLDLEAALNDQAIFNGTFFETLGYCFNLETLDVAGSNAIDDDAGRALTNAAITVGKETVKPGLMYLHTIKLSAATLGDAVIPNMIRAMPNLEHVEIVKCENIGEFGFKTIIEECPRLTFFDIAKVPIAVTYDFLDELKNTNPDLLIRRNVNEDADFKKDNGMRVPRRFKGKKKKKKKKKKGKKKR